MTRFELWSRLHDALGLPLLESDVDELERIFREHFEGERVREEEPPMKTMNTDDFETPEIPFDQAMLTVVGMRLTAEKAMDIMRARNMLVTGFIMQNEAGNAALVSLGGVRWMAQAEMWAVMHNAEASGRRDQAAFAELDGCDLTQEKGD